MRNQKNNVEQVSRLSNSNVAQASSLLFNVAQASSLFKTHRQDACSTLIKTVAILAISAVCTVRSFAQTEEEVKVFKGVFENPLTASEMVIKTLLKKMHHYPNHKLAINDIIAIYGLLRFADSTNNQKAIKDAETLYAGYLDGSWHISKGHLELDFLSIISAEFFRLTGNKKYLECLVPTAEDIIRNPKKDGLYRLARMWPEDMLFIGSSLASVWQVTGDKRFIDFAANNMILYLKTLQKNNGSIEYHSFLDSATVGKKEVSPMGNALALVALSDVLRVLPKNHKTYKSLLDGYTKLAS